MKFNLYVFLQGNEANLLDFGILVRETEHLKI